MDKASVQAFQSALNEKIRALGIETTEVDGFGAPQIGDTLRILLPVSDKGEAVITDFMIFSYEANNDLLQIYSTVVVELAGELSPVVTQLNGWNSNCTLGFFGVVERDKQLYHRYTAPVAKDIAPEMLAEQVLLLLTFAREEIAKRFPEAAKLAVQ